VTAMKDIKPEEIFKDKLVCYALPKKNDSLKKELMGLAKAVLYLEKDANKEPLIQNGNVVANYRSSSAVRNNNCDVAVLGGASQFLLRSRKFFGEFKYFCIPVSFWMLSGLIGLIRYTFGGRLDLVGKMRFREASSLLVFKNNLSGKRRRARYFGPIDRTPKEILQDLSGLKYVLLRWVDQVERNEDILDLDILIHDQSLKAFQNYIKNQIGLFPIDVYTNSGSCGHSFKSIPYYPQRMSEEFLRNIEVRESGVQTLTPFSNYTAYVYHLLFHKSDRVKKNAEKLDSSTWGDEKYFNNLIKLSLDGSSEIPKTICDLEDHLKSQKVFPMMDTISFLSIGNDFLKERYLKHQPDISFALSVFIVRDFGVTAEEFTQMIEIVSSTGYKLLASILLSKAQIKNVEKYVRGGNWNDDKGLNGYAGPRYLILAIDNDPKKPARKTLRRYPLIDNERLLVKRNIRKWFGNKRGLGAVNVIHASDNSYEAMEYLGLIDESLLNLVPLDIDN